MKYSHIVFYAGFLVHNDILQSMGKFYILTNILSVWQL